ncbi:MAG: hypothetical protein MJZ94_11440 [Bacteroidales bacterium]|nr:hypothetical protein [Bacteroidales bacterium]
MKSIINILSAFFVSVLATTTLMAQDCVICNDSKHSTFVGYNYSNNYSLGYYSYNLGWEINGSYGSSIIIGSGVSPFKQLSNPNGGIAFGMNSMVPTMRITPSTNDNKTGMVAIGNITQPLAKLHILSDNQEDAGIFLQTSNSDASSFIKLTDDQHCISVKEGKLSIVSNNNELNYYGTNAELSGNQFSLGYSKNRKLTMYANENPAIFSNAYRSGGTFYRNTEGSSYAIEFNNDALRIRTAVNQIPRGTEITNWKDALFLTTNGKVGIGSTETFLMNKGDEQLLVVSPKKMVFQTGIFNVEARDITQIVSRDIFGYATDSIRLTGEKAVKINGGQINMESNLISMSNRVGINTQYVPEDFAMAVNGGIISTRVHIRDLDEWPDFVFANGYGLMPLNELKQYVDNNNHLPDVPSEAEVNENGIDLGEMQSILLKKIEELTLYTIKQQEEIEALRKELNELKAK